MLQWDESLSLALLLNISGAGIFEKIIRGTRAQLWREHIMMKISSSQIKHDLHEIPASHASTDVYDTLDHSASGDPDIHKPIKAHQFPLPACIRLINYITCWNTDLLGLLHYCIVYKASFIVLMCTLCASNTFLALLLYLVSFYYSTIYIYIKQQYLILNVLFSF